MRGGIGISAVVLAALATATDAQASNRAVSIDTKSHRLLPATSSVATTCVGDCDLNGAITVDELLEGVNIALGTAALSLCPRFDTSGEGEVTVDEISVAISAALRGCLPDSPTPSRTATSTPTPTSTPTTTKTPTRTTTPPLQASPVIVAVGSSFPVGFMAVVDVTLTTGGNDVGGFQNDILFDNNRAQINRASDCQINPDIGLNPFPGGDCFDDPTIGPCNNLLRTIRTCGGTPQADGCPVGAGSNISVLRAIIAATAVPNQNSIPSGVAYTCTFTVVDGLPSYLDNANVIVANPRGMRLVSFGIDGGIVTSPPVNTPTAERGT